MDILDFMEKLDRLLEKGYRKATKRIAECIAGLSK